MAGVKAETKLSVAENSKLLGVLELACGGASRHGASSGTASRRGWASLTNSGR